MSKTNFEFLDALSQIARDKGISVETLLDALAKQNFSGVSPELRAEFLEFYAHADAPYATKRKPKEWARVQAELEQLKAANLPALPGNASNDGTGATQKEDQFVADPPEISRKGSKTAPIGLPFSSMMTFQ